MAVNADVSCAAVTGSAAPFVGEVLVYVDGAQVGSVSHVVTDDGPWWSFAVPLDVEGEHTVRVTDRPAVGGEYVVVERSVSCPVSTTTTTVPATTTTPVPSSPTTPIPATTAPEPTITLAVPSTVAEPFVSVAPTSTIVALTTPPMPTSTVAVGVPTTATVAPPVTLPATGVDSMPLVGVGSGLLILGALAVALARR